MGIFKYLKNLFNRENRDIDNDELDKNSSEEVQEPKLIELTPLEDKVNVNESKKKIDQELKKLRRLKYTESNFSLANHLECEVLNYLLTNDSNCFNVYWNLYVPYGANRYMQIDQVVVTGNKIYTIECKYFKNCTNIKASGEHWDCYYRDGKYYKTANGVSQNTKHISVLKKYLKEFKLEFKSIVILVVDDEFNGYIPDSEVILIRNKEFDLIFKLLDKKLKFDCDQIIDQRFVELNNKIYECMNPNNNIIQSHKKYIEERYE